MDDDDARSLSGITLNLSNTCRVPISNLTDIKNLQNNQLAHLQKSKHFLTTVLGDSSSLVLSNVFFILRMSCIV